MAALEVEKLGGSPNEAALGVRLPGRVRGSLPSSHGQEEEFPHEEMDKGPLLPEPISDTTTCPKGTCGPRQTSFPDLWTESHSVFFPHLHDVKKKK